MAQPVPLPTATALPPQPEALPPTTNPALLENGSLALYNSVLILASAAVLQHFVTFGILALLRGFSFKRLLDLHYLTLIFAVIMVAAPAVFLYNPYMDQLKLLFFVEHEAIEYLIAVRVLAPPGLVKRWSGVIIFMAWTVLFCVTVVIVLDQYHHRAAMVAAWGAFGSDFLLGITGAVLVKRWLTSTGNSTFGVRRVRAEGLAGIGFMTHGFMTLPVPPIFTCVLYQKMDPDWFAYAWVVVWFSAYFAVAFCIPAIALFFKNMSWCCGRRRKVFPGQVDWQDEWGMEDGRGGALYDPSYRKVALTGDDGRNSLFRPPSHRSIGSTMTCREPSSIR